MVGGARKLSLVLGCIADDYTGASDLANTLTRNGLRTVQTIGVPADDLDVGEADAVVVSLKSRSIAAAEAVSLSLAADAWLRGQGAAHVMFKICSTFDSTDAGNIGPVMDALKTACGVDFCLVTPAFPETGRSVYQGYLFVKGVPLHESPIKDHPLNPMRDSNLVRVLARQSAQRIGLVDFATVSRGAEAVLARQAELRAQGFGAAIADAVLDRDLEVVGAAASAAAMSVGASGLGLGLARSFCASGKVQAKAAAFAMGEVGGRAACLVGSCSEASLEQVARAKETMPVLRLVTENLLVGHGEIEKALAWAEENMAAGPVLIASSGSADEVAAVQAKFGREDSGRKIEQAMADIAAGLVERGVRRLAIGGGETSGAIVDRLGIRSFEVGPELAPGVPILRAKAMLLALKSGNFGGAEFFAEAMKEMK
jgi:uncharacterized protein YgbK (DUF1537 family)